LDWQSRQSNSVEQVVCLLLGATCVCQVGAALHLYGKEGDKGQAAVVSSVSTHDGGVEKHRFTFWFVHFSSTVTALSFAGGIYSPSCLLSPVALCAGGSSH
jgi:hypothetical protein